MKVAQDGVKRSSSVVISKMSTQMVDSVVNLHMAAFCEAMSSRLGRHYLRSFFCWFIKYEKGISLVALKGDKISGYIVGAPLGYQKEMNKNLAWVAACCFLKKPSLLFSSDIQRQLFKRFCGLLVSEKGNDVSVPLAPCYSLVGIGVFPSAQGKGIGGRLIKAFEKEASRRGAVSLRLSVNSDNDRARRVYEQAGWSVWGAESTDCIYYAKKMERPLDAGITVVKSEGNEDG